MNGWPAGWGWHALRAAGLLVSGLVVVGFWPLSGVLVGGVVAGVAAYLLRRRMVLAVPYLMVGVALALAVPIVLMIKPVTVTTQMIVGPIQTCGPTGAGCDLSPTTQVP